MVYDDDTQEPGRHAIRAGDRKPVAVGAIPRSTQERIRQLAEANRNWAPEHIRDQMRQEGVRVTLDEIYSFLYSIGWDIRQAGHRGR